MHHVLFVGNGVNRLSKTGPSWCSVIRDLADYVDKTNLIMDHVNEKPFTLVFEEIFFRSARARDIKETELKKRTADLINSIQPNHFHSMIVESGVRHIITTNYDYNLENSVSLRFEEANLSRETKYSLFRRRKAHDISIWHVHGESDAPNTLMLSHEHYTGAVQKMRGYLTSGRRLRKTTKSPFLVGDMSFDIGDGVFSWLDVFLRDEVHILGFSMDYTEIELWWLLSFKERLRLSGRNVGKTFFHQFGPKHTVKEKAKEAILESFGVEVRRDPKYQQSYEAAYQAFFDDYGELIKDTT